MSSSTDVRYPLNLRQAVTLALAFSAASYPVLNSAIAQEVAATEDVATLSDVNVVDDPLRAFAAEPSAASFGFAKPLLETPRTVTFVSEEQLRLFGVSTVEDLSRLVPGTYTTTRYGLQGGINVRGVSADFYYRGMKRLNMQGHVRTILSAYDNIEVIKGPPSPLYGLGKIGGYANLDPKSNRAKTGKYMTKEQGYLQATVGSYQKNELQFGLGVPFQVAGRASGVYIVGLLEDSDSYVRSVPAKQKFVQATTTVDNAVGRFRLETGGQTQNSITAGAYFTRITQDLIDNGNFIKGKPLAQLDLNGDGRIGYVESYLASPVTGNISTNNQALTQQYSLPNDANGNPLPISGFLNSIAGVPQSLKDTLTAQFNARGGTDACALATTLRTAPTASTTASATNLTSRALPAGFALDPCTVSVKQLDDSDYRGNGAFEREQNATQRMFYLDLIYDTDPNFTVKNQFFYDSLSSHKDSWLPYGENQAIRAIEDKVTVTKKLPSEWLPDWLSVNTLGSANYRNTAGFIQSSGGDFDFRQDQTEFGGGNGSGTGGFYSNTMFWTQLTNNTYGTGVPVTTKRESEFSEMGIGLMADIDIFKDTNVVIGGRFDKITAESQDQQPFNQNTGTVISNATTIANYIAGVGCLAPGGGCPGAFIAQGTARKDSDTGASWSASLSHQLPWNIRPYITMASTTLTLDAANNLYAVGTIYSGGQYTNKILGEATLKEAGVKGSLFRNKLQWTIAGFSQERADVTSPADPSVGVEVSSTITEGVEASVNFAPTRKLFIGASATYLEARYLFGLGNINPITGATQGSAVDVNGRDLGFRDWVAPDGTVYPAEAFLYGGRTSVLVYDPNNVFDKVPGSPSFQAALNTTYTIGKGFGVLANAQYFSKSYTSRLQLGEIPASSTINIGATWDSARIHLKANIYNLTDELTFRATNGGNRNMVSVLPDRRYEASLKIDF
jgi:outer membrane receptor protein involved in Fe transport